MPVEQHITLSFSIAEKTVFSKLPKVRRDYQHFDRCASKGLFAICLNHIRALFYSIIQFLPLFLFHDRNVFDQH